MSMVAEQLMRLSGEKALYVPRIGSSREILLMVQPLRRIDDLGQQVFLSKTYELWFSKGDIEEVTVNYDTVGIFLNTTDMLRTSLKITKIYPERDDGIPGDGIGMWHVEAVQ
jgi:hypothetical protein